MIKGHFRYLHKKINHAKGVKIKNKQKSFLPVRKIPAELVVLLGPCIRLGSWVSTSTRAFFMFAYTGE
jgi:hypothetical protein